MITAKSENGVIEIFEMKGTQKRIIGDIGALAHSVMLHMANKGAKSKEEVYVKYGMLARELVNYIDMTAKRVDEIENM